MKMFKKLMAIALVGVMALSMLTGCAITEKMYEDDVRDALKGALGAQKVESKHDANTAANNGFKKNKADGAKGTVIVDKTEYTYYTMQVDSYKKARQNADKLVAGLGLDSTKTKGKTLEVGVGLNTVDGSKGAKDTYYVTIAMKTSDLNTYKK